MSPLPLQFIRCLFAGIVAWSIKQHGYWQIISQSFETIVYFKSTAFLHTVSGREHAKPLFTPLSMWKPVQLVGGTKRIVQFCNVTPGKPLGLLDLTPLKQQPLLGRPEQGERHGQAHQIVCRKMNEPASTCSFQIQINVGKITKPGRLQNFCFSWPITYLNVF